MSITGLASGAAGPAAAIRHGSVEALVEESFRGESTTPGRWRQASPKGSHVPCLTAAVHPPRGSLPACKETRHGIKRDAPGQGAFRLTDNSHNDAGVLFLDKAIDATAGLHIAFDMFQYRTSTERGADGISFFLIDGKQRHVTPGEVGGMLGYKGLDGGIVGIGFDEFGNFSNPACCGKGGPGVRPNSVVVRGADITGVKYVAGVTAPGPLALDEAQTRTKARRSVAIDLSPANVLNISIDFHDGKGMRRVLGDVDLNGIPGQPRLPKTLKLGFAASTGGSTNFHEVRALKISALAPKLVTTVSAAGVFKAGGTGLFTIDVADEKDAGPATGQVTSTFDVPAWMTFVWAKGAGWRCREKKHKVTCTRPGRKPLRPGAAYPPIDIKVKIPLDSPDHVTVKTIADSPANQAPDGSHSAPATVPIVPVARLRAISRYEGTFTVDVANATKAGPTTGKVRVAFAVPDERVIIGVDGEGWRCSVKGRQVTCTRRGNGTDALAPGGRYPPILVRVAVPYGTRDQMITPKVTTKRSGR